MNSFAESFWRTNQAMARAMLLTEETDIKYWPLAVRQAVYISNRMPNAGNGWRVPYTEVYGTPPDLSHVRVFYSVCYVWIDPSQRKKLDLRAKRRRYVGHTEQGQYLVLDEATHKVSVVGKPDVVEAYDKLGQRISDRHISQHSLFRASAPSSVRPSPFVAKLSAVHRRRPPPPVLATTVWDCIEDHESVGLVQAAVGPSDAVSWVRADVFLTGFDDKTAAFERLVRHQELCARSGKHNDAYPVFAEVRVATGDRARHARYRYGQAIVTGVDPTCTNATETMYTVIFHPDVCEDQLYDTVGKDIQWLQGDGTTVALGAHVPRPVHPKAALKAADPVSYTQALTSPNRDDWVEATGAEMASLERKGVLAFGVLPTGQRALPTKFIFKTKLLPSGELDKHKVRLVAKGFLQQHGVDYEETFSPTFGLDSLRCVLALSLRLGMEVYHIDVKTAFLNSELSYDIYIKLPEGFTSPGGHAHAKLQKSLYGLKQAGRDWYDTQDDFIRSHDSRFVRSTVDPCLYYIMAAGLSVVLLVHVDDYVVASTSQAYYLEFNRAFDARFGTNNMGRLSNILQIGVTWGEQSVSMSQERQIVELAKQYGVDRSAPVLTPMESSIQLAPATQVAGHLPYRSLLGSLLWIMRSTRPDIAFSVTYLSHFCSAYDESHWGCLRRVLKYLYHTRTQPLTLRQPRSDGPVPVSVWSDSDWASDKLTRKSVSGYVVAIGGSPVAWSSKRQSTVALSSCEAEYMAMSEAAKGGLYVRNLLTQCKEVRTPMPLLYDNQGSAYMAANTVNNGRTKHIDIRHHFIRQHVAEKTFVLDYVPTATNVADVLTKALPREPFTRFSNLLLTGI